MKILNNIHFSEEYPHFNNQINQLIEKVIDPKTKSINVNKEDNDTRDYLLFIYLTISLNEENGYKYFQIYLPIQ